MKNTNVMNRETWLNMMIDKAIPMFEKYITKFPNGRYSVEVRYYMANCHYSLGDVAKAVVVRTNPTTHSKAAKTASQAYK